MKTYEVTFVYAPTINQDQKEEVEGKLEQFIKEGNGEVLEKVPLGRKKMAYPIEKQTHGEYFYWIFKVNGNTIHKVDDYLKMQAGILRHLTVRLK